MPPQPVSGRKPEQIGEMRYVVASPEPMSPQESLRQNLMLEYIATHPGKLAEVPMNTRENLELAKLAMSPTRLVTAMQRAWTRNYCSYDTHLIDFEAQEIGGVEPVRWAAEEMRWEKVTNEAILQFRRNHPSIRPNADELYRYTGIVDAGGNVPLLGIHAFHPYGPNSGRENEKGIALYAVVTPSFREEMRYHFINNFKPLLADLLAKQLGQAGSEEVGIVELNPRDLAEQALVQMGQELPEWDKIHELPGLSKIAVELLIPALSKYPGLKQVARDLEYMNKVTQRGIIFLEDDTELVPDRMVGWHPEQLRILIPKELLADTRKNPAGK